MKIFFPDISKIKLHIFTIVSTLKEIHPNIISEYFCDILQQKFEFEFFALMNIYFLTFSLYKNTQNQHICSL